MNQDTDAAEIEKLTDDVVVMQTAEGFVPSVWRNPTNDVLLGVYGYKILPAEWNCETRIVLRTMDEVLGDMQLAEVMRFFKLASHRTPLQDETDPDVVWEFKCGCGGERGIHLSNIPMALKGNLDCHRCGKSMVQMVTIFHDAYIKKKTTEDAKAAAAQA